MQVKRTLEALETAAAL